jgi:hypothetical protein
MRIILVAQVYVGSPWCKSRLNNNNNNNVFNQGNVWILGFCINVNFLLVLFLHCCIICHGVMSNDVIIHCIRSWVMTSWKVILPPHEFEYLLHAVLLYPLMTYCSYQNLLSHSWVGFYMHIDGYHKRWRIILPSQKFEHSSCL